MYRTITSRLCFGLALLAAAISTPAAAGSLEGDFEVRSAYLVYDHGVVQLNAHVQYPLNDRIRTALLDGVTLAFDLDVTISRRRRLWVNAGILDMNLRRELSFHAVTNRYVLRGPDGSEQESFATVEAALERLGRVEDLPILDESQLTGPGPWQVGVRADVRRGQLPGALRALLFWSDDWNRSSDWYSWTLTR
ncbi:MAG: DUF4390 domain-containing protein [Steroidobacterales bacterium]